MTIGELKQFIEKNNLPDNMSVGLIDTSTDDFDSLNYNIKEENLIVEDYVSEPEGEIEGKMLFITFENKLNPNPLSYYDPN